MGTLGFDNFSRLCIALQMKFETGIWVPVMVGQLVCDIHYLWIPRVPFDPGLGGFGTCSFSRVPELMPRILAEGSSKRMLNSNSAVDSPNILVGRVPVQTNEAPPHLGLLTSCIQKYPHLYFNWKSLLVCWNRNKSIQTLTSVSDCIKTSKSEIKVI